VPTLILHGAEDTVVPVEQSRAMNAKLLRAKKNVRYVELKGDDHWLSSASTRTQVLEEIDAFLTQSLVRAQ
jgi:dipeptidyl aminopeptidase/acylaminoacyl peptidase